MDKNKTIFASILTICITAIIISFCYFWINSFKDTFKDKDITIYDSYTFCIRSVMDKSKDNGKPCGAEDAERICSKFNK